MLWNIYAMNSFACKLYEIYKKDWGIKHIYERINVNSYTMHILWKIGRTYIKELTLGVFDIFQYAYW